MLCLDIVVIANYYSSDNKSYHLKVTLPNKIAFSYPFNRNFILSKTPDQIYKLGLNIGLFEEFDYSEIVINGEKYTKIM